MSDAFFEKLFGDSQPGGFGSGWMSGTASVFFGLLGFGGALCLHFPALLSLPGRKARPPPRYSAIKSGGPQSQAAAMIQRRKACP